MTKGFKIKLFVHIIKSQKKGVLNKTAIKLMKELINNILDKCKWNISTQDREDLIQIALEMCNKYLCFKDNKYTNTYSSCFSFFVVIIKHAMFSTIIEKKS